MPLDWMFTVYCLVNIKDLLKIRTWKKYISHKILKVA